MFETGLVSFLKAGNTSAADRVYPQTLPQGAALPALVYFSVNTPVDYTQQGESAIQTGRYQVECWGETYQDAKTLAEETRQMLSGFQGAMGEETVSGAFIEDEKDDKDPLTERKRIILDVLIEHS